MTKVEWAGCYWATVQFSVRLQYICNNMHTHTHTHTFFASSLLQDIEIFWEMFNVLWTSLSGWLSGWYHHVINMEITATQNSNRSFIENEDNVDYYSVITNYSDNYYWLHVFMKSRGHGCSSSRVYHDWCMHLKFISHFSIFTFLFFRIQGFLACMWPTTGNITEKKK